jgi:hypothetical protein
MTNLNSISSSLSSIDTIGIRRNNTTSKSSVDNLISQRDHHHPMTASTSAWWRNQPKEERYSTAANLRALERSNCRSSEIYQYGKGKALKRCLNAWTTLNFTLTLLLILTIIRQTFDFLGQLWLQILINFFTIIIIIIALFGLKQCRISYLVAFIIWSLFNTTWNLLVISIHFKIRDINLSEDILSLNTGAVSWWNTNGPGCLPYSITASIHQSVSILKPNTITGCRFDYHLLESAQAAIHASLTLISLLVCFYVALSIHRNPSHFKAIQTKDKSYRLNELTNGRSKVNHNPFPVNNTSRFVTDSASLRRPANRVSSRSSQRSMSSVRSERRRNRQLAETGNVPTPRGSVSSTQRSQKYGSLSSRRSSLNRRERRDDVSSLTYATTVNGHPRASGSGQRTRQSSVSSVDYMLPGYQPPHSSSANLLSSYGEISSIDSYNNPTTSNRHQHRMRDKGNTNPIYNGSRSSVCSQNVNVNNNNYDDISNVYGVNNINGSIYGQSNSINDRTR